MNAIWWIVVESVTDDEIGPDGYCGAKDKNFYKKIVGEAFLDMWPGDFDAQYQYICTEMKDIVNPQRKRELKRPICPLTKAELLNFLACLIATSQYAAHGINLWRRSRTTGRLRAAPEFSTVMSHNRFAEIKAMVPLMMEGEEKENDNWWKARGFVDG